MTDEEQKLLIEVYHELGQLITSYRALSILNYQYEYNRNLCENMVDAATTINNKAHSRVTTGTLENLMRKVKVERVI